MEADITAKAVELGTNTDVLNKKAAAVESIDIWGNGQQIFPYILD